MLAVAIRAVGRVAHSGFERFAVDAFVELPGNLFVALRAGGRDLPVAHCRLRVRGGENAVASMAIGANRRVFALQHGAPMDALQILLNGMKDWNFVAREKSLVCMALRASQRLIFLRDL